MHAFAVAPPDTLSFTPRHRRALVLQPEYVRPGKRQFLAAAAALRFVRELSAQRLTQARSARPQRFQHQPWLMSSNTSAPQVALGGRPLNPKPQTLYPIPYTPSPVCRFQLSPPRAAA